MTDPQGVFPNQLTSALIRGNRLYLPNIGSQPEPPELFNVNVQALVYNVDTSTLKEVPTEHVNLNNQIAVETAAPPPSLDRTFGNDLVAIDSNAAGNKFVIVSRGGNQVFPRHTRCSGKLNILNAAKTKVDCRLQTGNLPSGVAMRQDGTRAYANNEANFSVTSMNIAGELPYAATRHRLQHAPCPRQLRAQRAWSASLPSSPPSASRTTAFRTSISATSSRGISRARCRRMPGAAAGRAIWTGSSTG